MVVKPCVSVGTGRLERVVFGEFDMIWSPQLVLASAKIAKGIDWSIHSVCLRSVCLFSISFLKLKKSSPFYPRNKVIF